MSAVLPAALILLLVAVACAWSGYAIKYQGKYHLIAGFDAARVKDPEALAGWVGNGSMLLAAICAAGTVALLLAPEAMPIVVPVIAVITAATALAILAGAFTRGR